MHLSFFKNFWPKKYFYKIHRIRNFWSKMTNFKTKIFIKENDIARKKEQKEQNK